MKVVMATLLVSMVGGLAGEFVYARVVGWTNTSTIGFVCSAIIGACFNSFVTGFTSEALNDK